jgi:DNA processing protein
MSLISWLTLAMTDGVGPILLRRMLEAAGNAEQACGLSARQLRGIEGIGSERAERVARALQQGAEAAQQELNRVREAGFGMICPEDGTYPVLLGLIPDPPPVLYLRGTLEPRDLNAVAVVGSRKCSFYGREQADRFGATLASCGVTIVSGGARGIDSAAHRGALSHRLGRTLAVVGTGLDVPYPAENAPLFDQIAARGAVLSEYPLGTPPRPENFPRRNRIISGLSRGVVVVEADVRSGALITARLANEEHGRPVFAVPGRVDNPLSAGPHSLIRDGATLVSSAGEILESLFPLPDHVRDALPESGSDEFPSPEAAGESQITQASKLGAARSVDQPGLTERQRSILAHLSCEPAGVEILVEQTGLVPSEVLAELTNLSLRGIVRRVQGQSFALKS